MEFFRSARTMDIFFNLGEKFRGCDDFKDSLDSFARLKKVEKSICEDAK